LGPKKSDREDELDRKKP